MNQPALKDLLAVATEAAFLGGRRTLAYFNTGLAVETKADQSPVTCADREAEDIIRRCILRSFPDHAILGEETGATPGRDGIRWIIDPLDGTKTFIRGVPLFGTLVGIEVQGRPQVGVLYLPALDEMLAAASGLGCYWNGRPAHVSGVTQLSEATLLSTAAETAQGRSDAYARLVAATKLQRTWGDCYGYALVATGRAEIMLDPIMNCWDCAALVPIMQEAGGYFSAWNGEATIWGNDGVATNAALHDQVLDILKSEQRKSASS